MSELNLSSNSNPNFNLTNKNNYYSSKIKEGISIFQEQNGGNLYNNYIDPFKLLENEKEKCETTLSAGNFIESVHGSGTPDAAHRHCEPDCGRSRRNQRQSALGRRERQ